MEQPTTARTFSQSGPDFSVSDIFEAAWSKVHGRKATYMAASGLSFLTVILIALLETFIVSTAEGAAATTLGIAFSIVESGIAEAIMAGLFMLGVSVARQKPARPQDIFAYFHRIAPLLVQRVMTGILIFFGFILLILPGIYLIVAYMFAVPLLVDKELGPWQAMEQSRTVVSERWFTFAGIMLLTGVIVVISAIPLGIGLIWTIPFAYNVNGEMYVRSFPSPSGDEASASI